MWKYSLSESQRVVRFMRWGSRTYSSSPLHGSCRQGRAEHCSGTRVPHPFGHQQLRPYPLSAPPNYKYFLPMGSQTLATTCSLLLAAFPIARSHGLRFYSRPSHPCLAFPLSGLVSLASHGSNAGCTYGGGSLKNQERASCNNLD